MKNVSMVKEILEAIASVRSRADAAREAGNVAAFSTLMLDLSALERCLVIEATKLIDEYEQKAA